jgi:hypothetical protein
MPNTRKILVDDDARFCQGKRKVTRSDTGGRRPISPAKDPPPNVRDSCRKQPEQLNNFLRWDQVEALSCLQSATLATKAGCRITSPLSTTLVVAA